MKNNLGLLKDYEITEVEFSKFVKFDNIYLTLKFFVGIFLYILHFIASV